MMKKSGILTSAALLLVTIGSYLSIMSDRSTVRAVEFLFILVIGVLTGVLLTQIIFALKGEKK
jgi:hypothetical protein